MRISIYGSTLEAYVTAVCLALTENSVTLFSNSFPAEDDELPFIKSEPSLTNKLSEAIKENTLKVRETSAFINANIHWLFYKGKNFDELLYVIKELLSDQEAVSVVISTTLGVGTYNRLYNHFENEVKNGFLKLATLPSFIREGRALDDFANPELLLIGTEDNQLISTLSYLLSPVIQKAQKVMFISGAEAELIKTSICSMLATRLSLINELALLSEELHIDMDKVIEGVSSDSRIGKSYLDLGCGFGGLTLPQEVNNLLEQFSNKSTASIMLKAVVEANQTQKELLFRKLWHYYQGNLSALKVAIWGASFKPNSSSIANSPIHELVEALTAQDCNISIYDPAAMPALEFKYTSYANVQLCDDKYAAVQESDALFIVTAWDEFLAPDFNQLKTLMKIPVIFDGRNIYEPREMETLGFEYFAVGRGKTINL
ncbi:nucleotide sugar dehydrogenase [Kangiella sp. TOML190]|uniref:nucleotide sugar dehydrogenase n=1 Tax=Kangiella sp. TOML190 TaxID=2931351 RepID=UPI002041123B|nr:nucleotide sugar dehydrogenase [Kangiella sp. TOML190]